MVKQKRATTSNVSSSSSPFPWFSSPPRHHFQLGGHLHPSHQQRLESYSAHADHQLLQRAGGGFTLSLAEKEKGPQARHVLHRLCGGGPQSRLQGTGLPAASVAGQPRSSLCLIAHWSSFSTLHVVGGKHSYAQSACLKRSHSQSRLTVV